MNKTLLILTKKFGRDIAAVILQYLENNLIQDVDIIQQDVSLKLLNDLFYIKRVCDDYDCTGDVYVFKNYRIHIFTSLVFKYNKILETRTLDQEYDRLRIFYDIRQWKKKI